MVSRDRLFEEVWAEPMLKVAARYEVSSSFLARICERMNVPRPTRGYWARLAAGQKVKRPSLPPLRPGDDVEWHKAGTAPQPLVASDATSPSPTSIPASPVITERPKRKGRSGPHPLVIGAEKAFETGFPTRAGYERPMKRRLLDIYVSKPTLTRALGLASKFFLALEARGHRVTLAPDDSHSRSELDERENAAGPRYDSRTWRPSRPTVVFMGSLAIGLTVYELSERARVTTGEGGKTLVRIPGRPDDDRPGVYSRGWTEDMPSGRLCIRAYVPYWISWTRKWPESRYGELTRKLPEIVDELERSIPEILGLIDIRKKEAAIQRERWAAQERERLEREAEARRLKSIQESRAQLFAIVDAWGLAKRIEEFFRDAEERAATLDDAARLALLDRTGRARALLGGVDALDHFRTWLSPEERR
jgi:hypothetical protein